MESEIIYIEVNRHLEHAEYAIDTKMGVGVRLRVGPFWTIVYKKNIACCVAFHEDL